MRYITKKVVWVESWGRGSTVMSDLGYRPAPSLVFCRTQGKTVDGYDIPVGDVEALCEVLDDLKIFYEVKE